MLSVRFRDVLLLQARKKLPYVISVLMFGLVVTNLSAQSTWKRGSLNSLQFQQEYISDSTKSAMFFDSRFMHPSWDTPYAKEGSWISRKLFHENLIQANEEDYAVFLNPIFDFQFMKSSNTGYINTRGFHLEGHLKNRVFFSSAFFENQARFSDYLNQYVSANDYIPGYGRIKPYKETDWDFAKAIGSIKVKLSKYLDVSFGHDQLFLGTGHRSVFQSDFASPMLYFSVDAHYKKFRFVNISAQTTIPVADTNMKLVEGYYPHRMLSWNILEYRPNQHWTISLIEGVLFKRVGDYSPIHWQMFNPIIGTRSALLGMRFENNALIGCDVRFQNSKFMIYSQLSVDYFSFPDIAYQIGGVFWNIGVNNLNLRVEHNGFGSSYYFNAISFTEFNSITHFNQFIQHPLNNNFNESLIQLQYQYGRLQCQVQASHFLLRHSHQDVHVNHLFDNEMYSEFFTDLECAYVVNPSIGWIVYAGANYRTHNSQTILRVGMRTSLHRNVFDF